jgi:DNA phosphorothioation-dependent restriction protein DptG
MRKLFTVNQMMNEAALALHERNTEKLEDIASEVENWLVSDHERSAMKNLLTAMIEAAYDLEMYEE